MIEVITFPGINLQGSSESQHLVDVSSPSEKTKSETQEERGQGLLG